MVTKANRAAPAKKAANRTKARLDAEEAAFQADQDAALAREAELRDLIANESDPALAYAWRVEAATLLCARRGGLSIRRAMFCHHYFATGCSEVRAIRAAGYKPRTANAAYASASRMLKVDKVRAYLGALVLLSLARQNRAVWPEVGSPLAAGTSLEASP